jgi:hypothetical protein
MYLYTNAQNIYTCFISQQPLIVKTCQLTFSILSLLHNSAFGLLFYAILAGTLMIYSKCLWVSYSISCKSYNLKCKWALLIRHKPGWKNAWGTQKRKDGTYGGSIQCTSPGYYSKCQINHIRIMQSHLGTTHSNNNVRCLYTMVFNLTKVAKSFTAITQQRPESYLILWKQPNSAVLDNFYCTYIFYVWYLYSCKWSSWD